MTTVNRRCVLGGALGAVGAMALPTAGGSSGPSPFVVVLHGMGGDSSHAG